MNQTIVSRSFTAVCLLITPVANLVAAPPMAGVKPAIPKVSVAKPAVAKPTAKPTVAKPGTVGRPTANTVARPTGTVNTPRQLTTNQQQLANGLNSNQQLSTGLNANSPLLTPNTALTPQGLEAQNYSRMLNTNQNFGSVTSLSNAQQVRNGMSLLNQSNGTGLNPLLQQNLGLSNGQLSQIKQFQSNYNQELTALNARYLSDPQGTSSLYSQAQQQLQQQINSVMTPAQRQTLSQFTGTPDPFSTASPLMNPASITTATGNLGGGMTTGAATPAGSGFVNSGPFTNAAVLSGVNYFSQGGTLGRNALSLGNGGYLGLSSPSAQQALQLTPAQSSQLQNMQLNYIQQLGTLNGRFQTDPQAALSQYNNALQQSNQQIQSVLTPQQQLIYNSLTGVSE